MRQQVSSQPLISICVPTYNQPREIERFLKSILKQITPDIEIIIYDDSQNEQTKNIVQKYSGNISLRYYRGEKRGVDPVLISLVEKARGKYIWWFGDDMLADGALKHIVNTLRTNPDTSLMVINSKDLDTGVIAFDLGEDKFFRDKNQVIEEIADGLGYISAVIFEREKILPVLGEVRNRIGTAWVSLYSILHVLSLSEKIYYVGEPYVLGNAKSPDRPSWYDPFWTFTRNIYQIVMTFRGKFKRKSLRKMLNRSFSSVWKGVVVARARGYETGLGSRSITIVSFLKLFPLYWNFLQYWIALPFIILPRGLARVLYKFYKKFK